MNLVEGVDHYGCSEIYPGPDAGSEVETQVIMDFGRELIRAYPEGHVSTIIIFFFFFFFLK